MGIEDILFPKKCFGCGINGAYLCSKCEVELKRVEDICPTCEKLSIDGWAHHRCVRKMGIDRLISVYSYHGLIQKMLKRVKYSSAPKIIEDISYWWIKRLKDRVEMTEVGRVGVVTSVPMYYKKERSRGFNQARILGNLLANSVGVEYRDLLVRTRGTKAMYGLPQKERQKNVRGAFGLEHSISGFDLVILVDDVWTTGSTMRECCVVLKQNGAKEVWGITVAR